MRRERAWRRGPGNDATAAPPPAAPRYRPGVADHELTITDNAGASRYEAHLGAELTGFLEYRTAGSRRILLHTEVPKAFAGRGVGAGLARHALEAARIAGTRVTVKCPFIRTWLGRHPELASVATPEPGRRRAG